MIFFDIYKSQHIQQEITIISVVEKYKKYTNVCLTFAEKSKIITLKSLKWRKSYKYANIFAYFTSFPAGRKTSPPSL